MDVLWEHVASGPHAPTTHKTEAAQQAAASPNEQKVVLGCCTDNPQIDHLYLPGGVLYRYENSLVVLKGAVFLCTLKSYLKIPLTTILLSLLRGANTILCAH